VFVNDFFQNMQTQTAAFACRFCGKKGFKMRKAVYSTKMNHPAASCGELYPKKD